MDNLDKDMMIDREVIVAYFKHVKNTTGYFPASSYHMNGDKIMMAAPYGESSLTEKAQTRVADWITELGSERFAAFFHKYYAEEEFKLNQSVLKAIEQNPEAVQKALDQHNKKLEKQKHNEATKINKFCKWVNKQNEEGSLYCTYKGTEATVTFHGSFIRVVPVDKLKNVLNITLEGIKSINTYTSGYHTECGVRFNIIDGSYYTLTTFWVKTSRQVNFKAE